MKIEKKHIIIAIVAVVAIWLLWRKGVFSKALNDAKGITDSPVDPADSLEGVIAASGMNSSEARFTRDMEKAVEKSLTWKASIEDKARERGLTYYQMLALDAMWQMYYDSATNDFKPGTTEDTKSHVWNVQKAIQNI